MRGGFDGDVALQDKQHVGVRRKAECQRKRAFDDAEEGHGMYGTTTPPMFVKLSRTPVTQALPL